MSLAEAKENTGVLIDEPRVGVDRRSAQAGCGDWGRGSAEAPTQHTGLFVS